MPRTKPYAGTQSVQRAIAILQMFTDARPEWGLTELARAVNLNKTTTYRLLTALESQEMVTRHPDSDSFRLGLGAVTMGGYALRSHDLRRLCQPELKGLAAWARETAALELLTGRETLILDEVAGERVMSGGQAIGTRWPAYATSTGKAMLAYLPPDLLAEHLPPTLRAITPHTITDPERLRSELAAIRERGYAVATEELELGLVAVAAPLRDYDGQVVAAISLAGPVSRLAPERLPRIGQQLGDAARRLSVQLGYPPEEELPVAA